MVHGRHHFVLLFQPSMAMAAFDALRFTDMPVHGYERKATSYLKNLFLAANLGAGAQWAVEEALKHAASWYLEDCDELEIAAADVQNGMAAYDAKHHAEALARGRRVSGMQQNVQHYARADGPPYKLHVPSLREASTCMPDGTVRLRTDDLAAVTAKCMMNWGPEPDQIPCLPHIVFWAPGAPVDSGTLYNGSPLCVAFGNIDSCGPELAERTRELLTYKPGCMCLMRSFSPHTLKQSIEHKNNAWSLQRHRQPGKSYEQLIMVRRDMPTCSFERGLHANYLPTSRASGGGTTRKRKRHPTPEPRIGQALDEPSSDDEN
jgi:hypothetical protein